MINVLFIKSKLFLKLFIRISNKHNTSKVSPDLLIINRPKLFFLLFLKKFFNVDGSRFSIKLIFFYHIN